ncbi:hypothetical protein R1flu_015115 [Riccia fluitans]|uniref:Transmembrane protein n=1 Tax=Riccia fluitans TaxID=41844 RepID=A0ABD1YLB0_9MARC
MSDNQEISAMAPRLGLSQEGVAKLGGFGVLRESVRLFGSLHPSLVWIQFALVLPYSLYLIVVAIYAQLAILHALFPNLPPSPAGVPVPAWDDFGNLDQSKWLGFLLLVVLVRFCIGLVVLGTVFYAVGAIYYGRNATFSEVVHSVPRLWSRLFVTAIVEILLAMSVGVVYGIFIVIFQFTLPSDLLLLLVSIVGVISLISVFIINLMYQVANGVTCFEDHCGITSFRKGKHLLHDKWGSAVFLFILLLIPAILVGLLADFPVRLTAEFHFRWLVLKIIYVILTSYLTELGFISWAVFYFSCAANYKLNVAPTQPDDQLEKQSFFAVTVEMS